MGHTAVITFRDSENPNAWTPKVSGSTLYGQTFQLLQLHFHWDKRATHVDQSMDCMESGWPLRCI